MPSDIPLGGLTDCSGAAEILHTTPGTIRRWCNERRIPFVRLAGTRALRFRLSDLERIIADGLVPPTIRPKPRIYFEGDTESPAVAP